MSENSVNYFQKYIDHGLGHSRLSEESISLRSDLIRSKLEMIKSYLPTHLRTPESINTLSNELAEAAVIIQAFAIKTFGIYPSQKLRAKETMNIEFQGVHFSKGPSYHLNKYITTVNDYLSICRNKLEWLRRGNSSLSIALNIDGTELHVPDNIKLELIETITNLLIDIKSKEQEPTHGKRPKELNVLFNLVAHKLARFIQIEHFRYPAYYGRPTQTELLLISFTLMAAGYLPTPEEYEQQKRVKDYRTTVDKEYFNDTGRKRQQRNARFYTHNEALAIVTKTKMKSTKGFNARFFNWLWS